jgi:alkylated DNA nucleotide flippase Atl1
MALWHEHSAAPRGQRVVGRLIKLLAWREELPTHRVVSTHGLTLCPRGRGTEVDQQ